jgi:predicted nucleic acid-binding protein
MSGNLAFIDTNVLVYAYSIDAKRISPLINMAESTWMSVRRDIKAFIENN